MATRKDSPEAHSNFSFREDDHEDENVTLSLARYLVHLQDTEAWTKHLQQGNTMRHQLVHSIIYTVLPETEEPDQITTTVKAFMQANMNTELIELLERLILGDSTFSDNRNLQNLLILTAAKSDHARVMDYVTRLQDFDGVMVAWELRKMGLFEEAFVVFDNFNAFADAASILVDSISDMDRALKYAVQCDEKDVWRLLGWGQLNQGLVNEAVESFTRAYDYSAYKDVIESISLQPDKSHLNHEKITNYLLRAREKSYDLFIDKYLNC